MTEPITWVISREKAAEWGIDEISSMKKQPLCEVCRKEAEWIDCPTGGWWAHWEHPADDHDAVVELDEDMDRPVLVHTEYIESFRHQEEWSMVFRDPERNQYWEVPYYVTSTCEDVDRWNDAHEITLTLVRRVRVSRFEWTRMLRPVVAD